MPALGVGERGLKNDVRDARKLSEMDCRMAVPSVHIPSAARRAHQARLTAREALVRVRTKLINTVRSFVRMRAIAPIRATPPTLPRAVRAALLHTPEGVPEYLDAIEEEFCLDLDDISIGDPQVLGGSARGVPTQLGRPGLGHP